MNLARLIGEKMKGIKHVPRDSNCWEQLFTFFFCLKRDMGLKDAPKMTGRESESRKNKNMEHVRMEDKSLLI